MRKVHDTQRRPDAPDIRRIRPTVKSRDDIPATLIGLQDSCGDEGTRKRLLMGAAWTRRPGAPVPEPFPGRADREAAYRPLPNAGVTMDDIPEPHLEATVERRRLEPVILAVQDTTTLNCATLAAAAGRGQRPPDRRAAAGRRARGGLPGREGRERP